MLYKFLAFFISFYSPLVLAKYKVCSITINSDDEIKTFKKFLPGREFQFVELLPSYINEKQDHSSHWFDSACKENHQCDILVISGHFGGTFFGESGYALPTELLEEKSCNNSCPGILSNVKEIFLFGCNTLASKKKDHRSYTEYLQVLLDDGMGRETAERVVAARYSPLETPFYARMNFIFSGSHTVYGFDQLSPLGPDIRAPLEKYFKSINNNFGSYANYLQSKGHKRAENTELFKHLPRSHFSLNQAHISLNNENSKQKEFFKNKCLLYDDTANFNDRVQSLEYIFANGQSGSAFFAIDHFFNENKNDIIEGRGRQIFRTLKDSEPLSEEFNSYYEHLDFLPYIQIVYLNVLEKFQWMDPFELHILKKQSLMELIKKPDSESYTSLLLLMINNQIEPGQFYLNPNEFSDDYIKNFWGLLIIEKLKALIPFWEEDILNYCKENLKETPAICYQALNTLAHVQPGEGTGYSIFHFLESEDEGLILFGIRALGQTGIEDHQIHYKIASFLTHKNPEIRQEALEALGYLKTPYKDTQWEIVKLLPQASPELAEDIFWSLKQTNVTSPEAQEEIIKYTLNNRDNKELFTKAWGSLQNTSSFSDQTLTFLYKQLESREDIGFLLSLVEILSQNHQIKDLGIFYRFVKFQEEEDTKLKRKLLEKMIHLNWMHPETQISFLNFLEEKELRVPAITILKNIENLQVKTLNQIHALYKEKNIKELSVFL